MKYLTMIAVLMCMLAFGSCTKEKTCECTIVETDTQDPTYNYSSTSTHTFNKKAKEKCKDLEVKWQNDSYISETTCTIK